MRYVLASLALVFASCGGPSSGVPPAAQPASPDNETVPEGASTGLDSLIMQRTLEEASSLPQLRAIIVMRDGKALVEERFNGGPPLGRAVNIKSASKSVISAMVGMAIERGILEGVDQPVLSVLEQDAPDDPDPLLRKVTVGNLLSMQSGLERTSGSNYGRWVVSADWVDHALSRPFVDEPGGRMLYSTGNTHLLSAMLTRASGRSTYDLAQDWLGEPLGISIPSWQTDPQGIYFGGNNMAMSPWDMAAFGELYRLGGVVDGETILSPAWIEESWTPQTVSPWSNEQYGYGWFISEARGYAVRYAWGYGGQMIYILPELGLTVVMTSDTGSERGSGHIDRLHDLLANGIVPAAVKGR